MALSIDPQALLQVSNSGVENGNVAKALSASSAKTATKNLETWQVPKLDESFRLEPALQKAYLKASTYMNKLLLPDDLVVDLQTQGEDTILQAKDMLDGRIVKSWPGSDMLKLYARNIKPLGVVVDGAL